MNDNCNDKITVDALNASSLQGDRAVIDILKRFGARIEIEESDAACEDTYGVSVTEKKNCSVTVYGGGLFGIEIDACDIPDLVPILAVTAAFAKGTTKIKNVSRLRTKESDRLSAILSLLREIGADALEEGGILMVNGGVPLNGGTVSSFGDHRIAMAASIAASAVCSAPVKILLANSVSKSYPRFFGDLITLGGKLN